MISWSTALKSVEAPKVPSCKSIPSPAFEDDESVPSKTTLSPAFEPLASVAFKTKSSVSKVVPINLPVAPSYCKIYR